MKFSCCHCPSPAFSQFLTSRAWNTHTKRASIYAKHTYKEIAKCFYFLHILLPQVWNFYSAISTLALALGEFPLNWFNRSCALHTVYFVCRASSSTDYKGRQKRNLGMNKRVGVCICRLSQVLPYSLPSLPSASFFPSFIFSHCPQESIPLVF